MNENLETIARIGEVDGKQRAIRNGLFLVQKFSEISEIISGICFDCLRRHSAACGLKKVVYVIVKMKMRHFELTFVKMSDELNMRDEFFNFIDDGGFLSQLRVSVPDLNKIFPLPNGHGDSRDFIPRGAVLLELFPNTG